VEGINFLMTEKNEHVIIKAAAAAAAAAALDI